MKLGAKILSEPHQQIQDRFHEAGIDIHSPHFSAIRDGNEPALPEDDRPKSAVPQGIRILTLEGAALE